LAAPDSAAHTSALVLGTFWATGGLSAVAERVLERAERLGDHLALSQAYNVQGVVAYQQMRYKDAVDWNMKIIHTREAEVAGDPYAMGQCHTYPLLGLLALGCFAEARGLATRFQEVAAEQNSQFMAYAIAWRIQIETLAGEWAQVCALEEELLRLNGRDEDRLLVGTVRGLLMCAAARLHLGEAHRANSLMRLARIGGHTDARLNAPLLRVALARGDLAQVRTLFGRNRKELPPPATWWAVDHTATRLDTLAALAVGSDPDPAATATLDVEAAAHLDADGYLAAVADRALGLAHRDAARMGRAEARFAELCLPAQARITAELCAGIG